MGRPLYTNNAATYLAFGITNTATTMQVSANAGSLFPNPTGGDYFYVSLISLSGPIIEIVKCTARSGDIFTIERGQEGTSALYWNMGDNVQLRITAAGMNYIAGSTASTTLEQSFTATQGQTVFTLTNFDYAPGTNNLAVFVNGSKQVSGTNYTETNVNTVTFTTGLNVGDVVEFLSNLSVAAGTIYATDINYNEGASGAVTRTLESKLQESVSVKDFGAVGDGVVDDTAAIQAALNSGKLSIFVPEGTYLVSTLNIPSYVHFYGSGWNSIILSNGSANHVLSSSNSTLIYISDLAVYGNVGRSNLSGIYLHGCVNPTLKNVYSLGHGQHGVYALGNTSVIGVYPAWILESQFQNNVLDGINIVSINSNNQMNAVSIIQAHCIQNGRNGATLWGTNISFTDSVAEGNTAIGVELNNYQSSGLYSASNIAINNNYFEANLAGHIVITTTYGAINGLTIQNNFGFQNTTTIGVGYRSVACATTGENTIRQLTYSNNNFSGTPNVPTVIANFGGTLSYDSVVSPVLNYNSANTNIADVFAQYIGLGYAKFNCIQTTTPSGYFLAKGGSGITYSTIPRSDTITVSGSTTNFPLSIPLGSTLQKITIPVQTDSTNYSVQLGVFERPLQSAAPYATFVGVTVSTLSGSLTVDTGSLLSSTSQDGLRLTVNNVDLYLRVTVTFVSAGTYFYFGNPTLYYI